MWTDVQGPALASLLEWCAMLVKKTLIKRTSGVIFHVSFPPFSPAMPKRSFGTEGESVTPKGSVSLDALLHLAT